MKNFLFILLISPSFLLAQPTSQTFNASGSWVCPTGYSATIKVEAWGGGGGGGNISGRAGGGGGGAYASSTFDVNPGTYNITVGGAGAVGSSGGSSSFESTVIAVGGGSVSGSSSTISGAGGLGSACTGDTKFSGGNGGIPGSGSNGGGGGGGSATSAADGNPGSPSASGIGGAGGTGEGSGGKGANTSGSNPAIAGNVPGGGGGGRASSTNIASAAGAAGRVIVTVISSTVLPVSLFSFDAIIFSKSTLLSFSTATELNNSHFVIERSADARNFTEIGRVQGAGTTRVPQSYTFTDEKPLSGLNYYRLRQVDFDGAESLSGVVSVVFGKAGSITIAPSPATDRVRIQLDEALTNDGLWQVFDNMGRQVLSGGWEAESADFELDVNTLPEGMYTFRLAVGTQVQVKQFRKL